MIIYKHRRHGHGRIFCCQPYSRQSPYLLGSPEANYASLAHDIRDGSLSLSGVKVLVLAIG